MSWELVVVADGSSDGATEIVRQLVDQDRRVRPVIFARNFGHQVAVTAGTDYSRGQVRAATCMFHYSAYCGLGVKCGGERARY